MLQSRGHTESYMTEQLNSNINADDTTLIAESKEEESFNFMATITTCSDFGAQKNKVSHCFHC